MVGEFLQKGVVWGRMVGGLEGGEIVPIIKKGQGAKVEIYRAVTDRKSVV